MLKDFKNVEGNQKVLLIRTLSAIAALFIARSEAFEVAILMLTHRIVPRGNVKFVLIIIIFALKAFFGRRIFTRQACRRDRFRALDPYITILWSLSVNLKFTSTACGVAPVSPHLISTSAALLPCVGPCH